MLWLYIKNNFMQDKTNKKPIDIKDFPHGPWEYYWANGQLKTKGEYVHGNRHGPWIWYNENGRVWYKATYDMGKKIGYNIEYYRDGLTYLKRFYAR
jgi:antitoxin component YwqK of YwqJK toxin-antitoxin module